MFVIKVTMIDGREYYVDRRFRAFEALHSALERCELNPPLPDMPPKRLMKNSKVSCSRACT